jgi:hypothetical protein
MKEVRDKRGYAYSVFSHFAPHEANRPFPDRPADQAASQAGRGAGGGAMTVLAGFITDGPTAAELQGRESRTWSTASACAWTRNAKTARLSWR